MRPLKELSLDELEHAYTLQPREAFLELLRRCSGTRRSNAGLSTWQLYHRVGEDGWRDIFLNTPQDKWLKLLNKLTAQLQRKAFHVALNLVKDGKMSVKDNLLPLMRPMATPDMHRYALRFVLRSVQEFNLSDQVAALGFMLEDPPRAHRCARACSRVSIDTLMRIVDKDKAGLLLAILVKDFSDEHPSAASWGTPNTDLNDEAYAPDAGIEGSPLYLWLLTAPVLERSVVAEALSQENLSPILRMKLVELVSPRPSPKTR